MFHLLRRTSNCPSVPARKHLYLALVRSYLVYCSPLWRPYLIKDIENFERFQRRVTKFILNNYHLDYKSRLSQCHVLPLMYFFELNDILFLVKSLKSPTPAFNIYDYVTFNTSATRSGTFNKLIHKYAHTNQARHFFFNRIVRLWNSLPTINLNLTTNTIKSILYNHFWLDFWSHFHQHFNSNNVHTFYYLCPCS